MLRSETVLVTPEMAAKLLLRNHGNRAVSVARVKQYAYSMKAGQWKLNGEPIIVGKSGRLLNGQHRLLAVIESGVSVLMCFTYDVEESTFDTMDNGAIRTAADVLGMVGHTDTRFLASAVRVVMAYEEGSVTAHRKYSIQDIRAGLAVHPQIADYVSRARSLFATKGAVLPPSLASAGWYLLSRADAERADWFFGKLHTPTGLQDTDPVFVLGQTLLRNFLGGKVSRALSKAGDQMLALTIKAWNATCEGRQVQLLRFSLTEAFPVIAGYTVRQNIAA